MPTGDFALKKNQMTKKAMESALKRTLFAIAALRSLDIKTKSTTPYATRPTLLTT